MLNFAPPDRPSSKHKVSANDRVDDAGQGAEWIALLLALAVMAVAGAYFW